MARSSRTFLQLAQALVAELGASGGSGPASVVGQTGELLNLINWIADADVYVQSLWTDWTFLWQRDNTQTIASGDDTVPAPVSGDDIATVDETGLVLNHGTVQAYRPTYLNHAAFDALWGTRPKTSNSRPTHWTLRPDGVIELSHEVSADTPVRYDFWVEPARMTANDDTSPIPGVLDRIIVCRAKIVYAEREDAPEIMAGSSAEYTDLLEKLEARCLPGQKASRTAQSKEDTQAVVV